MDTQVHTDRITNTETQRESGTQKEPLKVRLEPDLANTVTQPERDKHTERVKLRSHKISLSEIYRVRKTDTTITKYAQRQSHTTRVLETQRDSQRDTVRQSHIHHSCRYRYTQSHKHTRCDPYHYSCGQKLTH